MGDHTSESVSVTLAQRIATQREARGLSQRDLADLLDVAQSTVSRIESGQRRVSIEELVRLAELLETTITSLLGPQIGSGRLAAAERLALELTPRSVVAKRLSELLELSDMVARIMQLSPPGVVPDFLDALGEDAPATQGIRLARHLREKFGLGSGPITDLFSFGRTTLFVDVAREPIDGPETGAMVQAAMGMDRVLLCLIDSSMHVSLQRGSYARFLCLSACRDIDLFEVDPIPGIGESQKWSDSARRAAAFAREFLLPIASLEATLPRPIRSALGGCGAAAVEAAAWAAAELALRFVVPVDFSVEALADSNLISKETAEALRELDHAEVLTHAEQPETWSAMADEWCNVIAPPQPTADAALAAYQHGLLGIGVLGRIFNTDERAMHEQVTAAGYIPDYDKVAFDGELPTGTK